MLITMTVTAVDVASIMIVAPKYWAERERERDIYIGESVCVGVRWVQLNIIKMKKGMI